MILEISEQAERTPKIFDIYKESSNTKRKKTINDSEEME